MAAGMVQDVYWRFNPSTKQVNIIADGKILESTTLAQTAERVRYHRHEAAKATGKTFHTVRGRKRVRA